MKSGQVAIQQALIKHFHLTYKQAAQIMGINPRTLWQHVAAHNGSNVRPWELRTQDEQQAAIDDAQKIIDSKK